MTFVPVQLVFEDDYCKTLQQLVAALCDDRLTAQARAQTIELPEAMTAGGDRNFANVLGPALGRPLAETKAVPARVIAIADADRPQNLVAGFRAAPGGAADDAWVLELESRWRAQLIADPRVAPHQERLRVWALRWNKESILIAARSQLLRRKRGVAQTVIDACSPAYDSAPGATFTQTFRDPARCMDRVARSVYGRSYKKGIEGNDLTRDIAFDEAARREVDDRCPDLRRLVDSILEVQP